MTTYKFPPVDKTLYGLTTGTVYEVEEGGLAWMADGQSVGFYSIAADEPDGVTDVRPFKVGGTVSSIEDLDALPNRTILRDESGAWEKYGGCFFLAGNEDPLNGSELADDDTPFTILWLPGTRNADS